MAYILEQNKALDEVLDDISFYENFIKEDGQNYPIKTTCNQLAFQVAIQNPTRGLEIFKDAVRKNKLEIASNLIKFYDDNKNFTALDDIILKFIFKYTIYN